MLWSHSVFQLISPNSSHLQASVYQKHSGGEKKPSTSVCSNFYYSMPVALIVILTVVGENSECYLSKETKTMHVLQMVQEQHSIYFG